MNNYIDKLDLKGEWKFYKRGEEEKYPVEVPGSVLSGMLKNNLCKDPFKGTNEYEVRELLRDDYIFETSFNFAGDIKLTWELVTEGIDTIAKVYINDTKLCSTDNAHRRYAVCVNKLLKEGLNDIRIEFMSPLRYIDAVKPGKNKEIHYTATGAMTGNQYVRKPHSSFGWDWGPQLPDMGIWRDIYLRAYDTDVLDYLQIKTDIKSEQEVYITVSGNLRNAKEKEAKVGFNQDNKKYALKVTVKDPEGKEIIIEADASKPIPVENAKFWWPNRLGSQPLYTVTAKLVSLKNPEYEGNSLTEKIGLRTFSVSHNEDEYGREFAFKVNGIKIFAKGADYIPEDCIYSRIDKDRIKHLIDSAKEAGFNTLRIWGGGYYPSDLFYELCDEAGLIVWQDFMFACNVYDLTKEMEASIEAEARDNVRRLRNHASLGLWCGNNECESAWHHWGGFMDHSKALKNDYLKIFEALLPKVVEKEDGEHFYWPSSPSSGGNFKSPDDENTGDCHYWAVWHGMKPFTDYENHYFRFCSEFGFESFPEMATVKTFAGEGDFNIFSEVMESHQKNGTANAKILHYISENFLYPDSFESLLYVSQVLQAMAVKYGVEHWRRNRGRCMGSLYWQINDNWPVASWSSIDYYGRWKALHYFARHFYADILGSVKREGNVFTPYISNESKEHSDTNVEIFVKTMDNEVVLSAKQNIKARPFSVCQGGAVDITVAVQGREKDCYAEFVFTNSDGTVTKQVEPVLEYKHMNLPDTEVNITTHMLDDTTIEATVSADKFAPFTALMCEEEQIIWDDNYFFLTGSEVKVRGRLKEARENVPDIKVMTLCNSYKK